MERQRRRKKRFITLAPDFRIPGVDLVHGEDQVAGRHGHLGGAQGAGRARLGKSAVARW
jgi:hypothetical protein